MKLKAILELFGIFSRKNEAAPKKAPSKTVRTRPVKKQHSGGHDNGDAPFSGKRIFYYFLFALLFLGLYLAYRLMQPFWDTIILACILAALSHPIYTKIKNRVGGRDYLASGLTIAMLCIVVCIPVGFFIAKLIPQASESIRGLSSWLTGGNLDILVEEKIDPLLTWLNEEVVPWAEIDVQDIKDGIVGFSRDAGKIMLGLGTGIVFDSIYLLAQFLLMLLIMFFLLKDGEGMVKTVKRLTPLREEQEDRILSTMRRMAKSVLVGGFAVAAIQGLVGGIGLAIVGIPALFWGTVMAFAALVPVLGTGLVWVPSVVYLLLTGHTGQAIFLAIWCGILVTSIDSILRPIIMRGSSKISLLFLFMCILGGIKAFGPLGLIYGPLILAFVMVMITIYSEEYSDSLRPMKHARPGHEGQKAPQRARPFGGRRKRIF